MLRSEQWEYYLNECLRRDRTILDMLACDDNPAIRWMMLATEHAFNELQLRDSSIQKLIEASIRTDLAKVKERANRLREDAAQ